ncbi:MAG TPA: TonB-dependent receptor [Pseudomonadales bacterium]|nr:TonB-dependent receptor [Pseudomonadales bacterium]
MAAAIAVASAVPMAPMAFAEQMITEEVVVTGSRIARDANFTSPNPVSTIDAMDIKLSGKADIADVLREQPALLTSVSSVSGSNSTFESSATSFGESVLQLRGMGAERTLVLVNGRRHVSGVEGSQSVDVGSIPPALIERVEVLTGGASAIYGADAVTGVVNFILKEDFEGVDLDVQTGLSTRGDGEKTVFSGLFGKNFADGRGNVTIALDGSRTKALEYGDRGFSQNNGRGFGRNNPALRFQNGDISAADTPNFSQFYDFGTTGRYPYGFVIPTADNFVADYTAEFGTAPSLTASELALIDRAANAPLRTIGADHTFSISSERGVIVGQNFDLATPIDLDGNGQHDCLDSHQGFNGLLDGAATGSFGIAGGCWTIDEGTGAVRPYQDGLIASNFNQFGGDGVQGYYDEGLMTPEEDRWSINVNGRFDLTDRVTAFAEAKYVKQEVEIGGPLNTFYDLLTVTPENPFIPAELAPLAAADGGLFITRDPTDLGRNVDTNRRETMRFVLGLEGELNNGWTWDVAANYGKFTRDYTDANAVLLDRYFAAIDVVSDPVSGDPICRSDIDPLTRPATTVFGIPAYDPGFFTFNPGDGQCVPINLLGGRNSSTPAGVDFVTTTTQDTFELEQTVFTANLAGELPFLELPGGAIGFAVGAEYREEKNDQSYDPLVKGVIPVDTPDAVAGTLIRDDATNVQSSLVFDPEQLLTDSSNDYDVYDVYAELSLPILSDRPFFRELTLDGAVRFSDYSTIGKTTTWGYGLSWAPVDDVRLRGTQSRAVRAPNIFELFSPDESVTFRPNEPCEQTAIDALTAAGDPRGPIRAANCAADGIPAGFTDPLSARFSGVQSGNANLQEETADTFTLGAVVQPRWVDGLTLTVDYWDIEIEDAIDSVDSQDIVDNCYDSPSFPNAFCGLFTRNRDAGSAQFLGFNFLRQTQLNFGAIEAAGVDFSADYQFEALGGSWGLNVAGAWMDELNYFFDPADSSAVDPELGEIQRPEWAGKGRIDYARGPLTLRWTTTYQDQQANSGVEVEDIGTVWGSEVVEDEFYFHDIAFSWDLNESFQLYGGVNNLTDEKPYFTQNAWPVSPLGRYMFVGVTFQN